MPAWRYFGIQEIRFGELNGDKLVVTTPTDPRLTEYIWQVEDAIPPYSLTPWRVTIGTYPTSRPFGGRHDQRRVEVRQFADRRRRQVVAVPRPVPVEFLHALCMASRSASVRSAFSSAGWSAKRYQ